MIRVGRQIHSGAKSDRSDTPEKSGAAVSSWPTIMAVVAFSLVFGCVILVKLHQEWTAARAYAEASQARTAAFIAERVSSRLSEVQGALAMAASQLEVMSPASLDAGAQAGLDNLIETEWVDAAALLAPDGRLIAAGTASPEALRDAASAALSTNTGLAARPGASAPLVISVPAPLADGSVGALIASLEPTALLPRWNGDEVSMLTDAAGRLLAVNPEASIDGAPFAAERLGLSTDVVLRMAERGGAMRGAMLGQEVRILGASAIANAPLQALSLGPDGVNEAAWNRTLLFHLLLFLAPLGTAAALSAMLQNQMGRLGDTQARLHDSEGRLGLAIEGARCGVWDWNLETDDVVLTDSFAQLIGRARGETLTGPELLLLLGQEDRPKVRAALRGAAQALDVDLEVRAAGLPVWLQLRGRLMPGSKRIIGVAIDITERKGAQARVAAAESRLRAALESMSESFVLWDARGRLVLWNRKFRDFFGFSDDSLRTGAPYETVETAAGRAIRAAHGSEHGADAYDLELNDGRWLHYSERRTADGGLVSVGADITALKAQQAALKENDREMRRTVENLRRSQERVQELAANYEQEKIRAEEANRSKSEFLANMSHELRTPLNAINGFSEIMAGEMFGPLGHERYQDYVRDILSSGQHLLSLINDILDMSKIEAGKMQLQPEPLMPDEVIEQCVRIMRARAEEKRIQLNVDGDDLPQIQADPRALKQVLLNLMSNAVKFTPEGGRVHVRGFHAADGIVLQVADTGIGISEDDLPRVGRPFEQIENQHSKTHQGSGLGLALSKSLVELHGGRLRIDSKLGEGTTVSFTLPAEPVAAAEDTVVEDEDPEPAEAAQG